MRRPQRLVDPDHRRQGGGGDPERLHHPALAVARRQGLGGGRRGRGQPLGVAQALALGQQRRLLGRVDLARVHLAHQLLEVGALALGRLPARPGRGEGPGDARQAAAQPRQAVRGRADVGPGEGVEHGQLARRAHQAPVLVLGREAHQGPRQRGHRLARGRLPVDQRPGAPLGGDAARDDDLALVVDQVAQGERRIVRLQGVPEAVGDPERGLHQGVLGARPHGRGVGGRAGQQAERLCQHRLARAGLARDGGQAAGGRQLRPFDDDEVADLERADHGRPNFSR